MNILSSLNSESLEIKIKTEHVDANNLDNKTLLISNIKKINNKHYIHNLYEFIKKMKIKHTINNNGIFFNLNSLTNKEVNDINKYVVSILNNIKKFKEETDKLSDIKDNISLNKRHIKKEIMRKFDDTKIIDSLSLEDKNIIKQTILNNI